MVTLALAAGEGQTEAMKALALFLPAALLIPAVAPSLAHAEDLSGLWVISSSVGTTPIAVDCSVLQIGDQLEGWCEPETKDATPAQFTNGQVSGTSASWGYDVTFQGKPSHVGFTAVIASNVALSGTLTLGTRPSPFTAARK